mmetsp:Transcript_11297/g.21552  ORF Transcript_11297/g.21552 Transcript_11297/m.21552 type:complete len:298 (+) Transcript_11297:482-1375(+)
MSFKEVEGRKLLQHFKSRGCFDGTRGEGDEIHQLTVGEERGRVFVGKLVELLFVHVCVNRTFNLTESRNGITQWLPSSVSTISTAVHLDQARSVFSDDNFSMRRTVGHSQDVKYLADVGDHDLGFFGFRVHGNLTKVYKGGTVRCALVIQPYHGRLVNAVSRDVVDDVFLALQELLAEHFFACSSIDLLVVIDEKHEMGFCFFIGVTLLHSVRSSRVERLHNHRVSFSFEELFDVLKAGTCALTNGTNTSIAKKFLLDLLVTTVLYMRTIAQKVQLFRQSVGQIDTSLPSTDAGLDI